MRRRLRAKRRLHDAYFTPATRAAHHHASRCQFLLLIGGIPLGYSRVVIDAKKENFDYVVDVDARRFRRIHGHRLTFHCSFILISF